MHCYCSNNVKRVFASLSWTAFLGNFGLYNIEVLELANPFLRIGEEPTVYRRAIPSN